MKTETKHTPGPWRRASNEYCEWITNEVGKAQIAKVFKPAGMADDTYEANVKLIAAAPAMLEALRALIQEMDSRFDYEQASESELKAFNEASALIAKHTKP